MTYSNDTQNIWHVLPSMLLDDAYDVSQLLEQKLKGTNHINAKYYYKYEQHYTSRKFGSQVLMVLRKAGIICNI